MARARKLVKPEDIRRRELFTIEGELDDISGSGQTQAAHDLCKNIPKSKKRHLTAEHRPLRHLQRPPLARKHRA